MDEEVKSTQPQIPEFDKSEFSNEPYVKRVDKPWGYELHLVPEDYPYMMKLLHVNAGQRMSLQIHDQKRETYYIIKGRGKLIWENAQGELIETELLPGQGYSTLIGQKHRLGAYEDEDCDILEASTPESGTTLRLEDDHGRPDETEEQRKIERGEA